MRSNVNHCNHYSRMIVTLFERPWHGGSRNHIGDQFGWWNQHHLSVTRMIRCRSCFPKWFFVFVLFCFVFFKKEKRELACPSCEGAGFEIGRSQVQIPFWPLADVVLGSPEFDFSATLVNSQLVCLPPVGILNLVMFIWIFIYQCLSTLVLKSPDGEWLITYTYMYES